MTIPGGSILPNGKIKIPKGSDVEFEKKNNGNSANCVHNRFIMGRLEGLQ
jgi:hypothetical protein